jgi:hypothetical protein
MEQVWHSFEPRRGSKMMQLFCTLRGEFKNQMMMVHETTYGLSFRIMGLIDVSSFLSKITLGLPKALNSGA